MLCLKRSLFACLRAYVRFQRACVCRHVLFYVLISKATKLHLLNKNIFALAERQNELRPGRANSVRVCKINRFAFEKDVPQPNDNRMALHEHSSWSLYTRVCTCVKRY